MTGGERQRRNHVGKLWRVKRSRLARISTNGMAELWNQKEGGPSQRRSRPQGLWLLVPGVVLPLVVSSLVAGSVDLRPPTNQGIARRDFSHPTRSCQLLACTEPSDGSHGALSLPKRTGLPRFGGVFPKLWSPQDKARLLPTYLGRHKLPDGRCILVKKRRQAMFGWQHVLWFCLRVIEAVHGIRILAK